MSRPRGFWKTSMDAYANAQTRNSPPWGGGCGFSSGYRERSPPACARALSRCVSVPTLSTASVKRNTQRSLSPEPFTRAARGYAWDTPERGEELEEGTPVSFFREGRLDAFYGWIRSVDGDGKMTVDVVGGGRIAGIREVVPCSAADIEKASRKKAAIVTRKDAFENLATRNRPPSRSPSPVPRLRGVAINLPP